MMQFGFSFEQLFASAVGVHKKAAAIMGPSALVTSPVSAISAISLGVALMFGTAGLPHILMRFFTVRDAVNARKSVVYATGFIGYFIFSPLLSALVPLCCWFNTRSFQRGCINRWH